MPDGAPCRAPSPLRQGQTVCVAGSWAVRSIAVPTGCFWPALGSWAVTIQVTGTGSVPAGSDTTEPRAKPSPSIRVVATSTVLHE